MAEVNGIKVPFVPVIQESTLPEKSKSSTNSFDILFQKELSKIKFSGHALKRLEARNINLNENELNRMQSAVQKAEAKGAKESLVMLNDKAFIVNIPNRTVITAMDLSNETDKVFTNIDSVVFT